MVGVSAEIPVHNKNRVGNHMPNSIASPPIIGTLTRLYLYKKKAKDLMPLFAYKAATLGWRTLITGAITRNTTEANCTVTEYVEYTSSVILPNRKNLSELTMLSQQIPAMPEKARKLECWRIIEKFGLWSIDLENGALFFANEKVNASIKDTKTWYWK